jgi:hypothetical protein
MNELTMEQQMPDSVTAKKSTAAEAHDASDEKTYKVWIEIEEYDERTGCGNNCDAPGGALATFGTYEEAYDFAEQIDSAYSSDSGPVNATKPFTVVGYWTDNEQGFIETTMAASAEEACDRARLEIAARNTADPLALQELEGDDQNIQIIAVFHGHLNCAFLQT